MAKENSAIGIEYNAHKIRAVELTKNADGSLSVTAFNTRVIPEGTFNAGLISDPVMFSTTVSELFSEGGMKNHFPIVLGVNNENVIMRYATFPKVPEDKLRGVITMQAQDFIPVPMSELALDFVVIDEDKDDDDSPVINVLLVGARNVMLDNILSNFDQSKMEVVEVDSSFLAWCRAAIEHATEDEVFGFMKMTDDVLNFVAVVNKEIKMIRSINIPDRALLEVKRAFNEAEVVNENDIQTIVELLNSELSSSINYFQMQNGSLVGSVMFSADCPIEKRLVEMLSERAYVPITVPSLCDDFMTTEFDPSEYAGCISLAKVALEG